MFWKTTIKRECALRNQSCSYQIESSLGVARLTIVESEDGRLGPWNGPFNIAADPPDLMQIATAYVTMVVGGVSSYNKKAWEESSLLRSYAVECFEEIAAENPEAGTLLENIEVDLRGMPEPLREHAMWKLHRAILGCLPGISFIA